MLRPVENQRHHGHLGQPWAGRPSGWRSYPRGGARCGEAVAAVRQGCIVPLHSLLLQSSGTQPRLGVAIAFGSLFSPVRLPFTGRVVSPVATNAPILSFSVQSLMRESMRLDSHASPFWAETGCGGRPL